MTTPHSSAPSAVLPPVPRTRVSSWALLAFVASLTLSHWITQREDAGLTLRLACAFLPFAAWLWGYWANEREFAARHDELAQRIRTEAHAIAYPVALGVVMLLGTLHSLGLGLIPPEAYWATAGLAYFVGLELARRRYR